jgi:hypothetical protein
MINRGLLVVVVVFACGSLALGGDAIGINFVGGGNDGADGGTVTGDTGVVFQPNWNNMIDDSGGPSAPLIDNTGATTATTVEWVVPNVWNVNLPDDGGSNSLMRGYLDNSYNLGSVTVRNVPFEHYDVYVYGDSDRAEGVIDGYLINGSLNSQQDRTEGGFTGSFVRGVDYVKFSDLSADANGTDLTITSVQVDGDGATPIAGVQVVNALLGLPELTLTVDRDTGNMTLSNETSADATFTGYAILSGDGALLPDQWTPITGNGWSVKSSTAEDLSQDTTSETTLAPGEGIDLGSAWVKYYDEGDIRLYASSASDVAAQGAVSYVGNDDESFPFGDLNFDGAIDIQDWTALQDVYGSDLDGLSVAEAYHLGDLTGDLTHDLDDIQTFREAFDAANGPGALAHLTSVPEPGALVLLGIAISMLACRRSLRRG